jgi:hypothetical protein
MIRRNGQLAGYVYGRRSGLVSRLFFQGELRRSSEVGSCRASRIGIALAVSASLSQPRWLNRFDDRISSLVVPPYPERPLAGQPVLHQVEGDRVADL